MAVSWLADQQNKLVNVSADEAEPRGRNAQFQVIDLGKGRVVLKSSNGRFVSVDAENAVLKDLAGKAAWRSRVVPMGQPDARRHDADVFGQSSLFGHQARKLRADHSNSDRPHPSPQRW